jgi:hypothetical protein
LGGYFLGMYLFGSLTTGDFDTNRSDIDFFVVTNEKMPKSIISDLKIMHKRLYESSSEWAKKLQGAYIPIDTMRVYSPTGPACPLVDKHNDKLGWLINSVLHLTGLAQEVNSPLPTFFR